MIRSWSHLLCTCRRPRVIVVLVGTCLLATLGLWAARSHVQASRDLRQAREAIEGYDFEGARSRLEAYAALRPTDGEGHFLLARTCRRARVEDFDQARRHLNEAGRLGWPRAEIALESLMLDFQASGTPGDSQRSLEQYLASESPGQALVFEALARGWIRGNHLERANACLNAWVKRSPDDPYAHLWRGAFFEYENKANLAVADFRIVLEKRPGFPGVRRHLGLMLAQSGYDYEEALRCLEPYRRSHPEDPDTLVGVASCRRALGQFEPARALLERVLAAHPDHAGALLERALVARDSETDTVALQWLRRLEPLALQSHQEEHLQRLGRLEPVPNNMDLPNQVRLVCHLLAGVLRRQGRHQEAEVYERRVEQLTTDLKALAGALEEQRHKPDDVDLMYRVGALFLRLEMGEDGAFWLRRVLEVRPGDRATHRALARYYRSRHDPESQRRARQHDRLTGDNP